jgi:AmmeMemoRadiSam system protein B
MPDIFLVEKYAINQINPNKKYKNIFIIASSHTKYFPGASIYNIGNYETPLGEVKVNIEICNELIKIMRFFLSFMMHIKLNTAYLKNDFNYTYCNWF